MARTQGHGNPPWNRDETILALALYFQFEERLPATTHPAVQELSDLLRALPYHQEASKNATFRNVASVSFKLQNLRQVATGEGLANVSRIDREIWEEFGNRKRLLAISLARQIRSAAQETQLPLAPPYQEIEFLEGRLLTSLHLRRERDSRIRSALLNSKKVGGLRCEICDLTRPDLPLEFQEALFEAHHVLPLAAASERKTKLADMALLCANCHRLTHFMIASKRRWIAVLEMRVLLTESAIS